MQAHAHDMNREVLKRNHPKAYLWVAVGEDAPHSTDEKRDNCPLIETGHRGLFLGILSSLWWNLSNLILRIVYVIHVFSGGQCHARTHSDVELHESQSMLQQSMIDGRMHGWRAEQPHGTLYNIICDVIYILYCWIKQRTSKMEGHVCANLQRVC